LAIAERIFSIARSVTWMPFAGAVFTGSAVIVFIDDPIPSHARKD
jgi:hypothetical protein